MSSLPEAAGQACHRQVPVYTVRKYLRMSMLNKQQCELQVHSLKLRESVTQPAVTPSNSEHAASEWYLMYRQPLIADAFQS